MLASQRTTSSFDLTELAATRPAPPPPTPNSGSSPSSPERRPTSSSTLGPARSPPKSPPRCSSRLGMRPTLARRSRYTTTSSRNLLEEMIPKAVVDSASPSSSMITRHKTKLSGDVEAEEETIEDISLDDNDISMKDAFLPFDTIAEDMDESDEEPSTDNATSSNLNSNTYADIDFLTIPTICTPPHKHSPRRPSALSPHRGTTLYSLPPSSPQLSHTRPSFLYRHVYPHRGHSRQALFQTRLLWQSRRAEWKRWEDEVAEADLAAKHGGIIWMPRPSPGLSWRSSPTPKSSSSSSLEDAVMACLAPLVSPKPALSLSIPASPPGLPPPSKGRQVKVVESMFPRAGDLHALRQTNACVSPDWTFRRVPLFRIHTTLFAHELRQACTAALVSNSLEPSAASSSSSTQTTPMLPYLVHSSPALSASTSSSSSVESDSEEEEWDRGGSPDSEATLVDDERLPSDIGAPPSYSEFDSECVKVGWLARWHVLAELLTSDGRPVPCSPVAVPVFGLSPVNISPKIGKGELEEQESPSEGKFDALMRMMVEDAIDAGQVEMRGRGSSSSSSSRSSSSSPTRNKARFFVPDLDEEEVIEESSTGKSLDKDDDGDSSDDEADDYDYGAPIEEPVFARLSSQLEVRRRAQIAGAA